MIKYTSSNQLTIEGFTHPFVNELNPENRWVKLAKVVPWDELAGVYAQQLNASSGRLSIDVRMVIGALIIKHKLGLDDRGTVAIISENIYLQYFCGLPGFQVKEPFHPTVFVDIRKRMGNNQLIIERADELKPKKAKKISQGTEGSVSSKHKGTLKIDATVANQKIVHRTDVALLNKARQESERLIDLLYPLLGLKKKPRTYSRIARREYLIFSKKGKKRKNAIRKFTRKQLGYLRRNLTYIERLLDHIEAQKKATFSPNPYHLPLPVREQKTYWVIQHIYKQQKEMYENKIHSIKNRIVNIYQPYVRPIVRGKDKTPVEFGVKVSSSELDWHSS